MLPLNLEKLVKQIGDLDSFLEISTAKNSATNKASYRLVFKNGEILKGRIISKPEKLYRIKHITSLWGSKYCCQILMAHENATIEEWINGKALKTLETKPSHLIQGANALASLHKMQISKDNPMFQSLPSIEERLVQLRKQIFNIKNHHLLGSEKCIRLEKIAIDNAPQSAKFGYTHRDYCAENLVLREDSVSICSIDNETITIGELDEDLARTLYRWEMKHEEKKLFLDEYNKQTGRQPHLSHFKFWTIYVMVQSLNYKMAYNHAEYKKPLNKIIEFLNIN